MCEYCDGAKSPLSFPYKYVYENGESDTIQYGFCIDKISGQLLFFTKNQDTGEKELLFKRVINYCPFCGESI